MSVESAAKVDAKQSSRLDVIAFLTAFIAGVTLYVVLHMVLHLPQWLVTTFIVGVMLAYAVFVVRVPKLRLRLDQAGDNAYYLGLLFTLVSMAFALNEFGVAVESEQGHAQAGARHIIANFGIALATTITGILLRLWLHQMRVDPADVEEMSRIELAEAAKRVRATLDVVTTDLGQFHDEVRQRSTDVVTALLEDVKSTAGGLTEECRRTTTDMLASIATAHKSILDQTAEMTKLLVATATEAQQAIERLRTVEPPPLTLSRRLEKVTKVLETVGDQAERIVPHLQRTAEAAGGSTDEIRKASTALGQVAQQLKQSQSETSVLITATVERVAAALELVGKHLQYNLQLLAQLEEQSRRSARESAQAQAAAVEVLVRMTEVARGLTAMLRQPRGNG